MLVIEILETVFLTKHDWKSVRDAQFSIFHSLNYNLSKKKDGGDKEHYKHYL